MDRVVRWALVGLIVVLVAVLPVVHYRYVYGHGKRLREVEPGRVYRSGEMTADGFRDARDRYGLRTVICLRDDDPDPNVALGFWPGSGTVKESELCRRLGLRVPLHPPRPGFPPCTARPASRWGSSGSWKSWTIRIRIRC